MDDARADPACGTRPERGPWRDGAEREPAPERERGATVGEVERAVCVDPGWGANDLPPVWAACLDNDEWSWLSERRDCETARKDDASVAWCGDVQREYWGDCHADADGTGRRGGCGLAPLTIVSSREVPGGAVSVQAPAPSVVVCATCVTFPPVAG